jgi:hypothetical protein
MDDDYKYVVKNLDTGENVDLDEVAVKYNVLTLAEGNKYVFEK